ncbi:MAG: hypothetical protein WBJ43_05025, partial [Smithellaceae bacterium]
RSKTPWKKLHRCQYLFRDQHAWHIVASAIFYFRFYETRDTENNRSLKYLFLCDRKIHLIFFNAA